MKRESDVSELARAASLFLLGVLGALASATAETWTFPFENVKTRMQMNGRQGLPVYIGLIDCIRKTLAAQGVSKCSLIEIFGFYRGLSASLLRQIPYSGVRIFIYEGLKRLFTADRQQLTFMEKLSAGGFAGALGCIFGTPGEVLKVRMINDPAKIKYKSLVDCARQTLQATGYQGFLKGFWVNVSRAIIVNACELASYDTFKNIFVKDFGFSPNRLSTFFCASIGSGFVAAVCSSPADVIKTRYMNQLTGDLSATRCAIHILRHEGLLAFFKGFLSYFFRMTLWNVIMFVSFEYYKALVLRNFN